MNKIENSMKASPTYWLSGFVATIVAATLTVEARYAKAGDVYEAKKELKQEMAIQRTYTDVGFLRQRKAQLEDKVFELEAKREDQKINQVERKQLFRFRSELDDVNRELRAKLKIGGS